MKRIAEGLAVLAVALGTVLPGGAAAQSWEEMSASRRAGGVDDLDVVVRYGAGRMQIRPGSNDLLYRMQLRYDAERFEPVVDLSGRRLELGTETRGRNINMDLGDETGSMTLELSPAVAMDLALEFGAVRATVDLGGLELTDLGVKTGASESTVSFSRPTRGRVRTAEFEVGAADFTASMLGNLRADRLSVEAGVGEITLEFDGEWDRDMEVEISMGLGSLVLNIPEDVGVRIEKDSFLTSLDADWLEKQDGRFVSRNWDAARHHVDIEINAALGSIRVNRIR